MYLRAKRKVSREISLYEPIGTDKEGNQILLLDIVESDEPDILEKIELHKNVEKIYRKLPEVLNEREKEIIILRYGLYNKRCRRSVRSQTGSAFPDPMSAGSRSMRWKTKKA